LAAGRAGGGIPKPVRLEPPEWRITAEALAAVASARTKLVILNSPLNPTATIASDEELVLLAEFCVAHDAIAICDEVWEHVVFDGHVHRSLMGFPGMRERTVKIGSAGKIFSLTGWKVGWMCAAPRIAAVLAKAHQFLTFTTPPNLQAAAAYGLGKDAGYFVGDAHRIPALARPAGGGTGRARLCRAAECRDLFPVDRPGALGRRSDDLAFCEWLVEEAGVAAIPVSAFYVEAPVTNVVRLCFAKAVRRSTPRWSG